MTESGLEMRSNPPKNSSISLPLAPRLIAVRLRIKIQKTYQACLCKFFCFKTPGLKAQFAVFPKKELREKP